jgi:hypothetical protein
MFIWIRSRSGLPCALAGQNARAASGQLKMAGIFSNATNRSVATRVGASGSSTLVKRWEAMGVTRFTLWTAAGSLIWNTIWIVAGYQLGSNWAKVEEYANLLKYLLVVVVVLAVAWFVWTHIKARRAA